MMWACTLWARVDYRERGALRSESVLMVKVAKTCLQADTCVCGRGGGVGEGCDRQ